MKPLEEEREKNNTATKTVELLEQYAPKPNLSVVPTQPAKKFEDYTKEELIAMPLEEFNKLKAGL